eukprot:500502-Prymnesium_polylepis.1
MSLPPFGARSGQCLRVNVGTPTGGFRVGVDTPRGGVGTENGWISMDIILSHTASHPWINHGYPHIFIQGYPWISDARLPSTSV